MGETIQSDQQRNKPIGWFNHQLVIIPLKTNMSPENPWLEDVFPTEIVPFLGDLYLEPARFTLYMPVLYKLALEGGRRVSCQQGMG